MLLHAEATTIAKARAAVVRADASWLVVSRLRVSTANGMARAAQHAAPADVCCSAVSVCILVLELAGFRAGEAHGGFCQVFSSPYITRNIFVVFSPGVKCVHHQCFYERFAML